MSFIHQCLIFDSHPAELLPQFCYLQFRSECLYAIYLGTSGGATKFFFTWVIQRTNPGDGIPKIMLQICSTTIAL